jgi:hypothetical protein
MDALGATFGYGRRSGASSVLDPADHHDNSIDLFPCSHVSFRSSHDTSPRTSSTLGCVLLATNLSANPYLNIWQISGPHHLYRFRPIFQKLHIIVQKHIRNENFNLRKRKGSSRTCVPRHFMSLLAASVGVSCDNSGSYRRGPATVRIGFVVRRLF